MDITRVTVECRDPRRVATFGSKLCLCAGRPQT